MSGIFRVMEIHVGCLFFPPFQENWIDSSSDTYASLINFYQVMNDEDQAAELLKEMVKVSSATSQTAMMETLLQP
jgi:pentatricopeptide repeat protein